MAGPTRYVGAVTRYYEPKGFISARDPFNDLVLHLEFLGAKDYIVELMAETHGIPESDAEARAPAVRAHARLAMLHLQQATTGPVEVSFLSGYYALLQLIKIYILFSHLHGDLATHRYHGATYNPSGPADRPLPEEAIRFDRPGAIWLFYQLLTGRKIPKETVVRMADVYPYMQDISVEWGLADRSVGRIFALHPEEIHLPGGEVRARWTIEGAGVTRTTPREQLPVIAGMELDPDQEGPVFRSVDEPPDDPDRGYQLGACLDRRYLYFPHPGLTVSALMPGPLLMPEEFPIVLAFFHLSAVSRYHPEYLEHLRDTRFWPAVAGLRVHSMYKFMLLFWSYLRQGHVQVGGA